MTEDYKIKRENYEKNSLKEIIKIFKNTNNNKFIEFLKTGSGLSDYTFEKESIELQNLNIIYELKHNEWSNDKKLLQQNLKYITRNKINLIMVMNYYSKI